MGEEMQESARNPSAGRDWTRAGVVRPAQSSVEGAVAAGFRGEMGESQGRSNALALPRVGAGVSAEPIEGKSSSSGLRAPTFFNPT